MLSRIGLCASAVVLSAMINLGVACGQETEIPSLQESTIEGDQNIPTISPNYVQPEGVTYGMAEFSQEEAGFTTYELLAKLGYDTVPDYKEGDGEAAVEVQQPRLGMAFSASLDAAPDSLTIYLATIKFSSLIRYEQGDEQGAEVTGTHSPVWPSVHEQKIEVDPDKFSASRIDGSDISAEELRTETAQPTWIILLGPGESLDPAVQRMLDPETIVLSIPNAEDWPHGALSD